MHEQTTILTVVEGGSFMMWTLAHMPWALLPAPPRLCSLRIGEVSNALVGWSSSGRAAAVHSRATLKAHRNAPRDASLALLEVQSSALTETDLDLILATPAHLIQHFCSTGVPLLHL
eukprot:543360-Amphidinium_carterae.1